MGASTQTTNTFYLYDRCPQSVKIHWQIYAPVAQWIRAPGFGPGCRGFESLPVYHA